MPEQPELVFEPFPSEELRRHVEEHVSWFTMAKTGAVEYQPIGYFLRNAYGSWVGGCLGDVWGNYLHVRWLWVATALRGQGQGERLLRAAEMAARDLGVTSSTLETLNPLSKSFYQRRGYEIFATLENYAGDTSKFFLRKSL